MPSEFKIVRQVEFSETDMAGLMHFSNFFRFMETAEHAFFRSLGYSIHGEVAGRKVGWPRVHAECDYKRPLRFEDKVEVELRVLERNEKTLRYEFTFRKLSDVGSEIAARGELVVACVSYEPGKPLKAIPIPKELADKIEPAPAK